MFRQALLLLLLIGLLGCVTEVPIPPVLITVVNFSQTLVAPGEMVTIHAEASGGEGDLTFTWTVDAGSLSVPAGPDTVWTAPESLEVVGVTLVVTDGAEDEATFSTDLLVGVGVDHDGDGFSVRQGDCNDTNTVIYPGAPDIPDGVDNDCDGVLDEGSIDFDDDGDGFTDVEGDCNDLPDVGELIFPGASEFIDQLDNDCDGITDEGTDAYDDDGDTFAEQDGDCDDESSAVNPSADESLDGLDNNCNGDIDEGTAAYDDDGDGFSEILGDCDDTGADGPESSPLGVEISDGLDNDCNGVVDDGPFREDDDGDGWTEDQGDCDDTSVYTFPGAPEFADSEDNDCNGPVDDGMDTDDGDGDGVSESQGDCDDFLSDVSPNAPEVDDAGAEIDNDCDGWLFTNPPIAVASFSSSATPLNVCTVVNLDGTASWDPDGNTLTAYWYFAWQPIQSALSSATGFTNGSTPSAQLTPDAPGLWIIGLYMNDGIYNIDRQ